MTVDYTQAVQEPMLRQRYLEELDFDEFARYVSNIRYIDGEYVNNGSYKFDESRVLMTTSRKSFVLKGTKSRITVYKSSFGLAEGDFLSSIDHELIHTEQMFNLKPNSLAADYRFAKKYGLLGLMLFYNYCAISPAWLEGELEAYKGQLKKIESGERKVSKVTLDIIRISMEYYKNVPTKVLSGLLDCTGPLFLPQRIDGMMDADISNKIERIM
ncbi:hypothetical protein J4438_03310 [Candidatus Woesearchaeota archaeon]|nr:hypothetical protein [Candidatus Woesearchaeota archaeon]